MKKLFLVALLLVVGGGAYYFINQKAPTPVESTMPAGGSQGLVGSESMIGEDAAAPQAGETKEFTLDSFEFGYDKKTITVNQGDTVKITLTNSGKMTHD